MMWQRQTLCLQIWLLVVCSTTTISGPILMLWIIGGNSLPTMWQIIIFWMLRFLHFYSYLLILNALKLFLTKIQNWPEVKVSQSHVKKIIRLYFIYFAFGYTYWCSEAGNTWGPSRNKPGVPALLAYDQPVVLPVKSSTIFIFFLRATTPRYE